MNIILSNGVFTSNFTFRVYDEGTKIIYTFDYANQMEEKELTDGLVNLLNSNMISGGHQASIEYSSTLSQLVGNLCLVHISISQYCNITIQLRVKKIDLYEGNCACFPYCCGDEHK